MKKIIIPLKKHPVIPNLSTKALIKIALDTPPDGGFTTSEMRSRIKILDKMELVSEEETCLELNESEASILKIATKTIKWAILDKFILDFEDSIE